MVWSENRKIFRHFKQEQICNRKLQHMAKGGKSQEKLLVGKSESGRDNWKLLSAILVARSIKINDSQNHH